MASIGCWSKRLRTPPLGHHPLPIGENTPSVEVCTSISQSRTAQARSSTIRGSSIRFPPQSIARGQDCVLVREHRLGHTANPRQPRESASSKAAMSFATRARSTSAVSPSMPPSRAASQARIAAAMGRRAVIERAAGKASAKRRSARSASAASAALSSDRGQVRAQGREPGDLPARRVEPVARRVAEVRMNRPSRSTKASSRKRTDRRPTLPPAAPSSIAGHGARRRPARAPRRLCRNPEPRLGGRRAHAARTPISLVMASRCPRATAGSSEARESRVKAADFGSAMDRS